MSRFGLPQTLRALLLDAGNTLVFLDMAAVAEVGARVGIEVEPRVLQSAEGKAKSRYAELMASGVDHDDGWGVFMSTLLLTAGVASSRVDAGVEALREEQSRYNLWRMVPEGLPEALKRARRAGYQLGVLSNSEGHIDRLLRRVGLADDFDLIVDSAVVGMAKPDPRIFHLACSRLHVAAQDVVYIGDIPGVDVVGAKAAGLHAVLIDPFEHFLDFGDAPRCSAVAEVIDDLLGPAADYESIS